MMHDIVPFSFDGARCRVVVSACFVQVASSNLITMTCPDFSVMPDFASMVQALRWAGNTNQKHTSNVDAHYK